MSLVEVKAPSVGESIKEVVIGDWLKSVGQWVKEDETLVVVESDKVNMEVPAPKAGVLVAALKPTGETVAVGEVIAHIDPSAQPREAGAAPASAPASAPTSAPAAAPASGDQRVMPSAQRVLAQAGVSASGVQGTGPGGRVLKEDAVAATRAPVAAPAPASAPAAEPPRVVAGAREVEVVRMSPLRKTVARRLLEAQQSAALLTTFNEVDMSSVMNLRNQYKDAFAKRHGVKLGFMSFFVRAVVEGLKQFPAVNAQIDGDSIIYHHYYDIGVAVGGGKGLVVPVIRNAEALGLAEIEATIADFGNRAKENRIKLDELQGGTFSITNGGIYGSLLSTPIINPPQSGILGMHGIQDRPIAVNGQVVIRPMMYIALTYDHRIIDGREAVSFLKAVKDLIEDPARILLEV
jgi:2-oxoglutarate dehydrogenase E2 component (dihydrolipoamide succinyltransferase)